MLKKIIKKILNFEEKKFSNKFENARHILKYKLLFEKLPIKKKYNIVECGVGAGSSLSYLLSIIKILELDAQIWAFDSFEGFPNATNHDVGKYKAGPIKSVYKKYSIEFVKKNLLESGILLEDINKYIIFAKGFFPDSFKKYSNEKIDFLHLDVDLYYSYKECLNFFWKYLEKGAIVLFDEYKSSSDLVKWPGASKAIDEFFNEKKINLNTLKQDNIFKKNYYIKYE